MQEFDVNFHSLSPWEIQKRKHRYFCRFKKNHNFGPTPLFSTRCHRNHKFLHSETDICGEFESRIPIPERNVIWKQAEIWNCSQTRTKIVRNFLTKIMIHLHWENRNKCRFELLFADIYLFQCPFLRRKTLTSNIPVSKNVFNFKKYWICVPPSKHPF